MFNIIKLLKCEHWALSNHDKYKHNIYKKNRTAVRSLAWMDWQYDAIGLTEIVLSNQNILTNKRQKCVR